MADFLCWRGGVRLSLPALAGIGGFEPILAAEPRKRARGNIERPAGILVAVVDLVHPLHLFPGYVFIHSPSPHNLEPDV